MATKKTGGSSRNGRDSHSKRLGLKKWQGHQVKNGEILVRQRGTRILPGKFVAVGRDHTLYATTKGSLQFDRSARKGRLKTYCSILPCL